MLKFELVDYELSEAMKKSLVEDCPRKQSYYYSDDDCVDGKYRKPIPKEKGSRKVQRYNYYTCESCGGKGRRPTELGRYLLDFIKEWS